MDAPPSSETPQEGQSTPHEANGSVKEPWEPFPTPATEEEKSSWRGFCEIESEPTFFNHMIEGFGVKGVRIQEVFGLDPESVAFLPKPIYGLIFLFRYTDSVSEGSVDSCPSDVWFANQTSYNSCASIALLNILNNIPDIELGSQLQAFKDATKDMSPALRGYQVSNFSFVRSVHNRFARKMDMLITDLAVQQQIEEASSKRKKQKISEEIEAYHFVAFVPINGSVWKLDGLDRDPQNIGSVEGDDWLSCALPDIEGRMALYEDQSIEFSLLSMVRDPVLDNQALLARTLGSLSRAETRLGALDTKWHHSDDFLFTRSRHKSLAAHHPLLMPWSQCLQAQPAGQTADVLNTGSKEELVALHSRLRVEEDEQIQALKSEEDSREMENQQCRSRQFDYAPAIQRLATMLAENGVLQNMMSKKGKKVKQAQKG